MAETTVSASGSAGPAGSARTEERTGGVASGPPEVARGVAVGYDGSPSAAPALTWAAAEAERRGTVLTVLHAMDGFGASAGMCAAAPELPAEAGVLARQIARDGVARARAGGHEVPVRAVTRLCDAATALVEASRTADLVVVGNRGRGALAGALLGSVAFTVSAQAHCPVVVVRGDGLRRPDPDHPVVVGVDGSPGAAAALRFAARLADRSGAVLRVVSAWTPPEALATSVAYGAALDAGLADESRRCAERDAAEAVARVREELPDLVVDQRVAQEPARLALARGSEAAGLVVVGARGHGCVAGLFLGSVSHGVIHAARCPVAVVRAPRVEPG